MTDQIDTLEAALEHRLNRATPHPAKPGCVERDGFISRTIVIEMEQKESDHK